MWLFPNTPGSSGGEGGVDDQGPKSVSMGSSERDMRLGQYRAYGRFYERYWSKLFGVTQADIARFVDQIEIGGSAPTLTDLAQDVVRARVRQGPQLDSGPAPEGRVLRRSVGRWDPNREWCVGDRVILPAPVHARGRAYAPCLGEITVCQSDHVVIHVDGISAPQVYGRGADALTEQSVLACGEMQLLAQQQGDAAQVDFVLWEYGSHVVSRLLQALEADFRFVELEGRWYLRDQATKPSDAQLNRLAIKMFEDEHGPVTVSDAMAVIVPGADLGRQSQRIGLALAMGEHKEQFTNVGTATHPRWKLACPPPMTLTAHHAVYDPETYAILCRPQEALSRAISQRLWHLGLLRAAIAPQSKPARTVTNLPTSGGDPEALTYQPDPQAHRLPTADGGRSRTWPKWLRFSRQ